MTVATQRGGGGGHVERSGGGGSSGLADVIELILDKGLVIDVFVRVSLVGIELLTIDARIVVASVDTFLRFAEATNRLDLYGTGKGGAGLPDVVQGVTESGSKGKTSGVLEGAVEKVGEALTSRVRTAKRRPAGVPASGPGSRRRRSESEVRVRSGRRGHGPTRRPTTTTEAAAPPPAVWRASNLKGR